MGQGCLVRRTRVVGVGNEREDGSDYRPDDGDVEVRFPGGAGIFSFSTASR